jgi:pilus assembly protein Flp/PilA
VLPVRGTKLKPKKGLKQMLKRFLKDETGLELSEYAVAAALVALAAVLAFQTLGGNISAKINDLAGKIQ